MNPPANPCSSYPIDFRNNPRDSLNPGATKLDAPQKFLFKLAPKAVYISLRGLPPWSRKRVSGVNRRKRLESTRRRSGRSG